MKEYKRLTMKNNGFIDTNCKNCKQCKKVGRKYICNDMTACDEEIINRLAELEDKIEKGTLKEVDNKVYPPNKSIGVWGDYCSKCGGLIGENGYEENYCSHCGAKLKEQQNER